MIRKIVIFITFLVSSDIWAKSLEQAAANLDSKASALAYIIIPVGFTYAGTLMVLGKEDGKQKMGLVIVGSIVIIAAKAIVSWLKSTL